MKAIWNGKTIAESANTVVVENNHYFPIESVDSNYLGDSDRTSFCPWKGTANYYSLNVDGETNTNAAWYYDDNAAPSQVLLCDAACGSVSGGGGLKITLGCKPDLVAIQ